MNRLMRSLMLAASVLAGIGAASGAAASDAQWSSSLRETDVVYAPRGYQQLCAARPEFCVAQQTANEVSTVLANLRRLYGQQYAAIDAPELTEARYQQLVRVNLTVNQTIRPAEDASGDIWSFSSIAGDCEEYVLMKRETLAALGWPRSAMRIGVVKGQRYPYHAILIVSTKGGEFVLDNMTDEMTRVEDSPYTFVVSESARMPGKWVRVHQTR